MIWWRSLSHSSPAVSLQSLCHTIIHVIYFFFKWQQTFPVCLPWCFLVSCLSPVPKQQGRSGEEVQCRPINQGIAVSRSPGASPLWSSSSFQARVLWASSRGAQTITPSLISPHGSLHPTPWALILRRSGFLNGASMLQPAGSKICKISSGGALRLCLFTPVCCGFQGDKHLRRWGLFSLLSKVGRWGGERQGGNSPPNSGELAKMFLPLMCCFHQCWRVIYY